MDIHALAFYTFSALGVALALALLGWPRWVAWQRQRVATQMFPPQWRKVLRRRVPLVRRLPVPLQLQLKKHMQVFIAEKPIIGCAGLRVSDEMRVVIAAQACLLVLNRSTDYFPNLRQILLYPGAFAVDRASTNDAGVQQEQRQAMAGESWSQGQVILSWQDCLEGAARSDDGRNVVIHEFAHQLDQENAVANGAPPPLAWAARPDIVHNAGHRCFTPPTPSCKHRRTRVCKVCSATTARKIRQSFLP